MTAPIKRIAMTTAAAAAVVLSAAGCQYLNDTQTHDFYQAADGTNAFEKGVGVRNAVLVLDKSGKGTLFATVSNDTANPGTASLEGSVKGQAIFSSTVQAPAQGSTKVGGSGNQQIIATNVAAKPGDIAQLTVTVDGQGSTTISLPVVDQEMSYYKQATASDGGK